MILVAVGATPGLPYLPHWRDASHPCGGVALEPALLAQEGLLAVVMVFGQIAEPQGNVSVGDGDGVTDRCINI